MPPSGMAHNSLTDSPSGPLRDQKRGVVGERLTLRPLLQGTGDAFEDGGRLGGPQIAQDLPEARVAELRPGRVDGLGDTVAVEHEQVAALQAALAHSILAAGH